MSRVNDPHMPSGGWHVGDAAGAQSQGTGAKLPGARETTRRPTTGSAASGLLGALSFAQEAFRAAEPTLLKVGNAIDKAVSEAGGPGGRFERLKTAFKPRSDTAALNQPAAPQPGVGGRPRGSLRSVTKRFLPLLAFGALVGIRPLRQLPGAKPLAVSILAYKAYRGRRGAGSLWEGVEGVLDLFESAVMSFTGHHPYAENPHVAPPGQNAFVPQEGTWMHPQSAQTHWDGPLRQGAVVEEVDDEEVDDDEEPASQPTRPSREAASQRPEPAQASEASQRPQTSPRPSFSSASEAVDTVRARIAEMKQERANSLAARQAKLSNALSSTANTPGTTPAESES